MGREVVWGVVGEVLTWQRGLLLRMAWSGRAVRAMERGSWVSVNAMRLGPNGVVACAVI